MLGERVAEVQLGSMRRCAGASQQYLSERWVALGVAVNRLHAAHREQRNSKGTHEAGVQRLASSS